MNAAPTILEAPSRRLSDEGRARLLSRRGEPLFFAGWERVLFIHYEVDAAALQRDVPFPIDLRDGKAYVSLVAFTMRGMHPRFGGRVAAWLFKPVATHEFLNVRTYVRNGDERGIFFLTEWLSNRLSVKLGPWLYGLPYHYAKINYRHHHEENNFAGEVRTQKDGDFEYIAEFSSTENFAPCPRGSLDEFLMERYMAGTSHGATRRFFRIWHPPWQQTRVEVFVSDDSLLKKNWPWFNDARLAGANYSPGFDEVWMGRAHRVR